jgi:hypothetical protein
MQGLGLTGSYDQDLCRSHASSRPPLLGRRAPFRTLNKATVYCRTAAAMTRISWLTGHAILAAVVLVLYHRCVNADIRYEHPVT